MAMAAHNRSQGASSCRPSRGAKEIQRILARDRPSSPSGREVATRRSGRRSRRQHQEAEGARSRMMLSCRHLRSSRRHERKKHARGKSRHCSTSSSSSQCSRIGKGFPGIIMQPGAQDRIACERHRECKQKGRKHRFDMEIVSMNRLDSASNARCDADRSIGSASKKEEEEEKKKCRASSSSVWALRGASGGSVARAPSTANARIKAHSKRKAKRSKARQHLRAIKGHNYTIDDEVAFFFFDDDDNDDDDDRDDDDLVLHAPPRSDRITNGMHQIAPLRSHRSNKRKAAKHSGCIYGLPCQGCEEDYDDDDDDDDGFKHVDREIESSIHRGSDRELDDDPLLESNRGSEALLMHTRSATAECQSPSYQPSIKDSKDSGQLISPLHGSSAATANACDGFENVYEDVPLVEADDAADPVLDAKNEWLDAGEQQYLSVADRSICGDDSDLEDADGWLLVS